jgi:hypothetical protein
MHTHARRGSSAAGAASAASAARTALPRLSASPVDLPAKMAQSVSVLLRPRGTRDAPRRITVSPMSTDWLQQSAVKSAKRGDSL